MSTIDLNADLGELPGDDGATLDAAILAEVTSCSVACGGHAGDEGTMRRTLRAARAVGVQAGAHPSYPDREGFGRHTLTIEMEALAASLDAQVGTLIRAATAEGASLVHLKPHGALYSDAARDEALAAVVASCARRHGLALYGPPGGALREEARAAGVAFVAEGFADRLYRRDGGLTPRGEPGAVIEDEDAQRAQAVALARGEPVRTGEGPLSLSVQTICLHGDTPGAAGAAASLREALEAAGVTVRAPSPGEPHVG